MTVNWVQEARQSTKIAADSDRYADKPYQGKVTAVRFDTDQSIVASPIGETTYVNYHPYIGPNSWIRVCPEPGTGVLCQYRSDANWADIIGYTARPSSSRNTAYDSESLYYRPLQYGEIDLLSKGLAQVFLSQRGSLELRGGSIHTELSQDDLECKTTAPTHKRFLNAHTFNVPYDEERLGVVKRPDPKYPYTKEKLVKVGGSDFAKEYMRIIGYSATPSKLVDYREGHVVDDSGKEVSGRDGNKLRIRSQYFTSSDSIFDFQLDEKGNLNVAFPSEATAGLTIKAPNGESNQSFGKNYTLSTGQNYSVSAQINILLKAISQATLKAALVKLGDTTAFHPSVRGDLLSTSVLNPILMALTQLCTAMASSFGPFTPFPAVGVSASAASAIFAAASSALPGTLNPKVLLT